MTKRQWAVPATLGVAGLAVVGAAWLGVMQSDGDVEGASVARIIGALPAAVPAQVSVPSGAVDVAPDSPVTLAAPPGERLGSVTLSDPAEDDVVTGSFSAGDRTWTSTGRLRSGANYTLTAVTVGAGGETGLRIESFRTAFPQADALGVDLVAPSAGELVGVGQPVVVSFQHPVKDRAAVQAALSVASDPVQRGSWSWLSDTRVDYRPEQFWRPGTTVTVKLGLYGLDDGSGRVGTADQDFTFTVGRDQETPVDLRTHQATVRRAGQVIRSYPISGGMPGLDTWGGILAVIDKSAQVDMNSATAGLGDAYNIPDVMWDVHLTYSGTYMHAAPWSVSVQGVANVSHGCIGASTANAKWFFDNTLPGDVVRVVNSPRPVAPSNGFGDWQESWAQWTAGSALRA